MDSLVSTDWLEAELGAPDLRVIDATYFLPGSGRDARAEYEAAHIPGAVFFDIDEISDAASPLPHMLPPEHKFASRMQSLGLGDGNRFVVYDNSPLHSAARAWWMLRIFGAHHVALLDGGLQKWKAEGRPLASGREQHRHGHFTAFLDRSGGGRQERRCCALIGGARRSSMPGRPRASPARMPSRGRASASGHIPGARNAPQSAFFNPDNSWKLGDELRAVFDRGGRRPCQADGDDLRLGRHRRGRPVRRASARQAGRPPLRRQLVRMGRRSRHAQGEGRRREGQKARDPPRRGRAPRGMDAGAGQSRGLARLDHLVRQRRRDEGRQSADGRHAPLRPQRHADDLGPVRGADRDGAGRGDDPALPVRRGGGGRRPARGARGRRRIADGRHRLRPDPRACATAC